MSKRRSNQRQADNVAVPKKIPRYEREAIVLPTERFIRFCEENQLEKVKEFDDNFVELGMVEKAKQRAAKRSTDERPNGGSKADGGPSHKRQTV